MRMVRFLRGFGRELLLVLLQYKKEFWDSPGSWHQGFLAFSIFGPATALAAMLALAYFSQGAWWDGAALAVFAAVEGVLARYSYLSGARYRREIREIYARDRGLAATTDTTNNAVDPDSDLD